MPTYDVRQFVYTSLPWPDFLNDFDEVMSSGYSVSVFTTWTGDTVSQVWIKATGALVPASMRSAVPAHVPMHMIPGQSSDAVTAQLGIEGPWHE